MALGSVKPKVNKDDSSTPSSIPARKPKPRSYAPPGEKEATAVERKKKPAKSKAAGKNATPLKKSPLPFKAKGSHASCDVAGNGGSMVERAGVGKNKTASKPQASKSLLMEQVWGQGVEFGRGPGRSKNKAMQRQGVLMRPTKKTQNLVERLARAGIPTAKIANADASNDSSEVMVFRVIDLPEKIRKKIWRFAVVFNEVVAPDDTLYREQPDLAMTCRQVRGEVLPIFYSENIFLIDVVKTRFLNGGIKATASLSKWADALKDEDGKPGWFSMIRNWAFDCSVMKAGKRVQCDEEKSFMAIVKFFKKQRAGVSWDASVELHRGANCILPGSKDYGLCHVQMTPAWLNKVVIDLTNAAKGGHIKGEMIIELALKIKEKAECLAGLQCEDVMKSIEPMCLAMGPN